MTLATFCYGEAHNMSPEWPYFVIIGEWFLMCLYGKEIYESLLVALQACAEKHILTTKQYYRSAVAEPLLVIIKSLFI